MMNKHPILAVCVLAFLANAAVHAEKSAGEHVDDTTMTARVKMALLEESASDAIDINVETSMGVVQLAGFVDSEKVKSKAGQIAKDVDGVRDVSNRLTVKSGSRSAGRTLDDMTLAAKVKLELVEDERTNAGRINVEVRSAVVELSGFVDSYAERDAAVELVSGIDGVSRVLNSIDITR